MKNDPKYILIHCTDYSYRLLADQFVACNGWHKDRQFPLSSLGLYIGYQRLITGDTNYKCRLETDVGSHCNQGYDGVNIFQPGPADNPHAGWSKNAVSMNFQSLGVCVGFDGDVEFPTPKQYELLQKQVWEWQDFYKIPNENVFFHRKFAPGKSCPGSLITAQWLADLLKRPLPVNTAPSPTACIVQDRIIAEQKVKLAWYESLIAALKALLNK